MYELSKKFRKKNILFDFCYLFIVLLATSAIFLISTYIYYELPLFDDDDLKLLNYNKLILFIVIIPLIEEFALRGIFDLKNKLFIFLFILCSTTVVLIFAAKLWISIPILAIVLFVGGTTFFNLTYRNLFNKFIARYFIYFLTCSSICFGLLHLNNYETIDIHTILKILPRIVGGFYLGYIAKKYGILYSWLMHAVNNLIPIFLAFFYTVFSNR